MVLGKVVIAGYSILGKVSALSLSVILPMSVLLPQLVLSTYATLVEEPEFYLSTIRALDINGNDIGNSIDPGEQIMLTLDGNNKGNSAQSYIALVQINTEDGETVHIAWQIGAAAVGDPINSGFEWKAEEPGSYTVRSFLWTSLGSPTPISEPSEIALMVGDAGQCTTYVAETNTISVQCNTSFEVVARENPTRIINEGNGTFLVNSIVQVESGKALYIRTPIKYLKITEDNGLRGVGSLFIYGAKITSWDQRTNDVISQNVGGSVVRGWIIGDSGSGVVDIRNSDIGYLGYAAYDKQGIVYYNDHGRMFGNEIHHNYYGVFSYKVSDLVAENNTLHNNILYGFDPHTYTNNSTFRNNVITDTLNGIGLICSLHCSNITFENNRLINNKVGIMLSMHMDNSIVRNNTIIGSFDVAMSVSDSANNTIEYNHIFDSRYGIAMRLSGSQYNEVRFNDLHNIPRDGIQINAETSYNSVRDNLLQNVTNAIVNRSTTTALYNNISID